MGAGRHSAGCTAMGIRDMDADKDPKGAVMNDAVNDLLENVRQGVGGKIPGASAAVVRRRIPRRSSASRSRRSDYTVIPAAEVASRRWIRLGHGVRFAAQAEGRGRVSLPKGRPTSSRAPRLQARPMEGAGGGGGGGGGAMARPVAVIVMGPDGVEGEAGTRHDEACPHRARGFCSRSGSLDAVGGEEARPDPSPTARVEPVRPTALDQKVSSSPRYLADKPKRWQEPRGAGR